MLFESWTNDSVVSLLLLVIYSIVYIFTCTANKSSLGSQHLCLCLSYFLVVYALQKTVIMHFCQLAQALTLAIWMAHLSLMPGMDSSSSTTDSLRVAVKTHSCAHVKHLLNASILQTLMWKGNDYWQKVDKPIICTAKLCLLDKTYISDNTLCTISTWLRLIVYVKIWLAFKMSVVPLQIIYRQDIFMPLP